MRVPHGKDTNGMVSRLELPAAGRPDNDKEILVKVRSRVKAGVFIVKSIIK